MSIASAVRHAEQGDLVALLNNQPAAKLDIPAPATTLHTSDGSIEQAGVEWLDSAPTAEKILCLHSAGRRTQQVAPRTTIRHRTRLATSRTGFRGLSRCP